MGANPSVTTMEVFICKYCNKECKNKNSLTQHEIRCKDNPNKIKVVSNWPKHYKGYGDNQYTKAKKLGLPKPEISEETRLKLSVISKNRKLTEEQKEKRSIAMKLAVEKFPESYSASNVNGRVKHIKYNDINLDSSWEYEVAKALDENNIKWERNKNYSFKYFWNDKEHKYFPDFYLPDLNIFIEVKGYERERDLIKYKTVDNLLIIKKNEIDNIKNDSKFILNILNL